MSMLYLKIGPFEFFACPISHDYFDIASNSTRRAQAGLRMGWRGRPLIRLGRGNV